jgi:hypothetical protein
VDLFKGFQQEPEEPFRLRNWNDPETGRSVDPAEVGGLHQVVSEPTDFLFAYHCNKRRTVKGYSLIPSIKWYQS